MSHSLYIGTPSYNGLMRVETHEGLRRPCLKAKHTIKTEQGSLLAYIFNRCLHNAYNTRKEYGWNRFLLHHVDVAVLHEAGWADDYMDEQDRCGADVLSAVIPIKDGRGLSSTGLVEPGGNIRRLTMKEIFKLPETFNTEDCVKILDAPGCHLVVNTGLLLLNFDKVAPFCRPKHTGPDDPGLFFSILDGVRENPDGTLTSVTLPEDWHFSRSCRDRRLKVMATRKIKVKHFGDGYFDNCDAWGAWETDLGDHGERVQKEKLNGVALAKMNGWTQVPFEESDVHVGAGSR